MQSSKASRPPARLYAVAKTVLSAAALLLTASASLLAQAESARLTPEAQVRANTQIVAIAKDKEARTPAQKKMDSRLIYAAREASTGKAIDALPEYHTNLKTAADGTVAVDIKGKITPELLAAVKAEGGKIVNSHPEADVARVTLPLLHIEAIAARPEVRFIARPPKMTIHTGSVDATSEQTMLAAQARTNLGVTGAGVSVGVLSDSADNGKGSLAAAYASGDLDQNNTVILSGQAGTGEGEGNAMMQIIHDIAPGAKIYFGTAFGGADQFAANIRAMQKAGCKVICDDVTDGDESPFQDQVISNAVIDFCASGGLYFSAVGNGGNKATNTATAWEGDFKDGGDASALDGAGSRYHVFTSSTGTTSKGNQLMNGGGGGTLFWSDPLGASSNDYDLFELNPSGTVVNMSTNTQDGSQDPFESFDNAASGDSFVIVKAGAAAARFLHVETGEGGKFAISTDGELRGHNGPDITTGFFGVAATPSAVAFGDPGSPTGPYPNAFDSTDKTEIFSSDGPRRMFYKADGTAYTPGNFSSTGGKVFAHPDITAADGVNTSESGFAPFFGTSAAAPDAAGVAALLLSKYPSITPVEADTAMRTGVVKINEPAEIAGSGIILATQVLAAAAGDFAPAITSATTATAMQGKPFTYQITATAAPTSFNAAGLPAGLKIDVQTGEISGTPTAVGKFTVALEATNSVGQGNGKLTLTVVPEAPVITSATTATAAVGDAFTYQITATDTPTSFNAAGLPAGLKIDLKTGAISGMPTVFGTFTVALEASNAVGQGNAKLTLTVTPAAFFAGEAALSNGVYYLALPGGTYFGYYSFLSDADYIYHFDLGYEYVFDAKDASGGVYLYDFASSSYLYTSRTLPFPYLYDFKLQTFLYYYPDPNHPGHYNMNGIRYFYDFNTQEIITM